MSKSADSSVESLSLSRRFQISWRMFRYSWTVRPLAVVIFLLGCLLEIGGFLASIFATAKLGALLAQFVTTGSTDYIWFWLVTDIAAAITTAMGFFLMSYAKRTLYFAFVRWSTNNFLSALCTIDLADFYDKETRNTINKVGGGYTWQIPNMAEANLDLIYSVLRFSLIALVVAQITWWLIPIIGIFLIPSLIAESRLAKLQWFVWDAKGDQRHVFWGLDWIIKQAKGQMEIRSTQANKYLLDKVNEMNKDFYTEQEIKYKHASKILVPTKIIEVAGTAVGSVVLLKQFLARSISLDRYFFLSGAILCIGGALNTIFGTLTRMQESLLFADSYFKLTDKKPSIVNKAHALKLSTGSTPEIVFDSVTFTYPGQDMPVFKNLNLHIKAGEHVALVGENGAGKSTLIKLLLRFYKPDSGKILVNGHNLNDINVSSWYEQLATLFQDFNHYPFSIRENIMVGRSNKPEDQLLLEEAARFGDVDKLVSEYEHGWDTVLDASFKKGVEPSGGQWQRVALARAFYRQANIIILDEPTSAIDALAEYNIFNSIFEHYKNKSAIIVSHRFSTVRRADRIVVLDNGKIIEEGSHAELMRKGGTYHDLFSKQAEGYQK